jgi:hypothetical protein
MHTVERAPPKGEHTPLAESQESFFHKGLRGSDPLSPTSKTKKTRGLTTPKPFSFHDSKTASSAQKEKVLTLEESMNQFNLKGLRNEPQKKSKASPERKSVKKLTQPIPFTFSTSKNPRQGEYAEAKKNDRKTMAEQLENFSSKGLRYDPEKKKAASPARNTYQRPKPTRPIPFHFSVSSGESVHSKKNDRKKIAQDVEPISSKGIQNDSENESKASSHDSHIDQLPLTEPDLLNLNVLDDENAEANIDDPETVAEDVEQMSSIGQSDDDSENESNTSSHDHNIDEVLPTEPGQFNFSLLDEWAS